MKENKILMSYKLVYGANTPEGLKKILRRTELLLTFFFFFKKNCFSFYKIGSFLQI